MKQPSHLLAWTIDAGDYGSDVELSLVSFGEVVELRYPVMTRDEFVYHQRRKSCLFRSSLPQCIDFAFLSISGIACGFLISSVVGEMIPSKCVVTCGVHDDHFATFVTWCVVVIIFFHNVE